MSASLQDRNMQYFEHLLRVGVIDNEQYDAICEICGDKEEKQILFAISNFFANFTASDWFDLSCRMFNHWQRGFQNDPNKPQSHRQPHYLDSSKSNREHELAQREYEQEEHIIYAPRSQDKKSVPDSDPETKPWEPYHEQPRSKKEQKERKEVKEIKETALAQTTREEFERKVEATIDRFCDTLTIFACRTYFTELKNDYYQTKPIKNSYKNQAQRDERLAMPKTVTPSKQTQKVTRQSSEKDTHSKLYYDHFQKQAQMEHKRQAKKDSEMDDCTFVPQINKLNSDNEAFASNLRVPVFDRLLQSKAVPTNVILEKQEYRELKGATFKPDISQSQKKNWAQDKGSPDDRKQDAVERLYSDAQIKEKVKFLKEMEKKEKEIEGCTFSPNVMTPNKDRERFIKNDLSKSVDRLYEENMKRHRKMLRKEVEVREQELDGCTFQPERQSRNFKPKNEDEFEDLEVHDRLYERFKKKREITNSSMQQDTEERGTSKSRGTIRGRSNSAAQDKSLNNGLRSPQKESVNLNTPAFDRLYRDMAVRKLKRNQIIEKVNKEEGVTFKPQTNWSKKNNKRSTSVLDQSNQNIKGNSRFNSKYTEEEGYHSRGEPEALGSNYAINNMIPQKNNLNYQPNQRKR